MNQATTYKLLSLLDETLLQLKKHDYSRAVILGVTAEEIKEELYGKPIG